MPSISGYVERIVFKAEGGYHVLAVSAGKQEFILTGNFTAIDVGEYLEAETVENNHYLYGKQYNVISYKIKAPEDLVSITKYLSSGAVKGVKEVLAERIVKEFKADTLRVIEEEPEKLAQIKGISEKLALSISEQIIEKKEMRDAMIFLQKYGIGMNLAASIYKEYGEQIYTILVQNPYRMIEDIQGVGFKIADDIALRGGISTDSTYRMKSGIIYVLEQASLNGNTYLPQKELIHQASLVLKIKEEVLEDNILDLQFDRKIVVKIDESGNRDIYLSKFYYTELEIAKKLHDLNLKSENILSEKELSEIEKSQEIELDKKQRLAVAEAISSGLLVITGGPGTGKTTTIKTIIEYFDRKQKQVLLAAPTGRAAKKLSESTKKEAKTIHRLLEINGMPDDDVAGNEQNSLRFEKDAQNPLEADVIIIDEMSMVDIFLMNSLLEAITVGTRLILLGDVNQLPSVGAGNVLRDIIDSEDFNVVCLDKIYRQSEESDIILNAHNIINGENIDLDRQSKDFLYIRREGADNIINAMLTLISKKLPEYVNAKPYDIQVISPMRKGALGVERLNQIIQSYLNPASVDKVEKEFNGVIYRVGDKVMQIKNNYQLEWTRIDESGDWKEKGLGIYNGDIGIIKYIDNYLEKMVIEFDDNRLVHYGFESITELEHAFAITIHKSQGSEYPAVIIPLYQGAPMLMTRNLIYTAVTRAKKCVTLIGKKEYFTQMINNNIETKRYSGLKQRILELKF